MANVPKTWNYRVSSIEFKKPSVTASNAITQQCKNLRVNGAILNHLHVLNKKIDSLLAVDWIVIIRTRYRGF
ncbi:hypothetical protein BDF21DRAFT_413652 [Thamnidium elegans]|nr:hypothetical protein BDF21DRAFT_413652 [Thamnidium elegans]